MFVFKLDLNDMIIDTKVYDTKNVRNIEYIKDKTSNEIVKRGFLEKMFGGVGPQQ